MVLPVAIGELGPGRAPVPASGQPPRRASDRRLRSYLIAWTGQRTGLLLFAAVVRVVGSAPRAVPWSSL